jgi:hypothetical protein
MACAAVVVDWMALDACALPDRTWATNAACVWPAPV